MGSNRKRPFGYRMELGESVLHPAEAETVRWIYDSYLAGASYNALVDKLQERGIPYDGDKPWNKNMAARRAIQCLKSFLLEKSRPFLYKTPYATSQIQTEQIQRSKRVMGGIRTPTDIGLMLFCLLLMRIVPSIKLLVCFGNNPHSLIGAAKSVVM